MNHCQQLFLQGVRSKFTEILIVSALFGKSFTKTICILSWSRSGAAGLDMWWDVQAFVWFGFSGNHILLCLIPLKFTEAQSTVSCQTLIFLRVGQQWSNCAACLRTQEFGLGRWFYCWRWIRATASQTTYYTWKLAYLFIAIYIYSSKKLEKIFF